MTAGSPAAGGGPGAGARTGAAGRVRGLLAPALAAEPPSTGIPALFLALTTLSGMIDAVSVLHFRKVFVANMTGNLVFGGLGIARAPGFAVAPSVLALAGFAAGGVLCRTVLARGRTARPLVAASAGTEALLLTVAAVITAATGRHPAEGVRDLLIVVCAAAFGIQNVTAGRVAVPGLTTTVMTRTLVGLIDTLGVPGRTETVVRQGLSVILLVSGAAVGGVLTDQAHPAAAIGTTAVGAAVVAGLAARERG